MIKTKYNPELYCDIHENSNIHKCNVCNIDFCEDCRDLELSKITDSQLLSPFKHYCIDCIKTILLDREFPKNIFQTAIVRRNSLTEIEYGFGEFSEDNDLHGIIPIIKYTDYSSTNKEKSINFNINLALGAFIKNGLGFINSNNELILKQELKEEYDEYKKELPIKVKRYKKIKSEERSMFEGIKMF